MMKKLCIMLVIFFIAVSFGFAKTSTTKVDGGSNRVELTYSSLNSKSSLHRDWIAINDDQLPAKFEGTPGVTVIYKSSSSYSSGGYRYTAELSIKPTVDISAIEVRFITFDVFGNKMRNLSATYVQDMAKGAVISFSPQWTCSSENDAEEYLSSIAYIAQVRTSDGKVYYYDADAIVSEVLKFTSKFSADQIED